MHIRDGNFKAKNNPLIGRTESCPDGGKTVIVKRFKSPKSSDVATLETGKHTGEKQSKKDR